jgi:ABC-type transport system involved in cytochrome c biogenesis permease subunit
MKKWIPLALVALFAIYLAGKVMPKRETDFGWQQFGRIPVMANGRFQPIDSLARNSLLQLREKASALTSTVHKGPNKGRSLPANEWIAEMLFKPELADTRPVFRVDNLELKQTLGLPVEPDETKDADGKHFSYAQLKGQIVALQEQASQAAAEKPELRSQFQRAVLQLWGGVQVYWRLQNLVQPQIEDILTALRAKPPKGPDGRVAPGVEQFLEMVAETKPRDATDWRAELREFLAKASAGREAAAAAREGKPHDEAALLDFKRALVRFEAMSMKGQPLIVPSHDPVKAPDAWHSASDSLMHVASGEALDPAVHSYADMAAAFRSGNSTEFNRAVNDYLAMLKPQFGMVEKKAAREVFFNRLSPFSNAAAIKVAVVLCAIFFWFAPVKGEWLRRSAVWLCLFALLIHTSGLIFRMTLEGRPPVTNLYSAAVFIGWAACILGLVLELVWRNSIGILVSAVIGFSTLLIAHHLSLAGDTMEMMRAVLDTNFWLATHVVIVTLGYASTYVAGFLAIVFVLRGLFTRSLDLPLRQSLAKMVYAIACFATLFSFVGTVLGGIWADQSWGRFWGWDPKENGALIIVLWNVLILHARWGGLVRERGLMNLAIFGNVVTTWSFFGTNMLGVGLHSYGFMDEQRVALIAFCASQIVLIGLASIPLRFWRSYRNDGTPPANPPRQTPVESAEPVPA